MHLTVKKKMHLYQYHREGEQGIIYSKVAKSCNTRWSCNTGNHCKTD